MRPLFTLAALALLSIAAARADVKYTFSLSVVTDWQTVQMLGGARPAKAALQARVDDASRILEQSFGVRLVVGLWTIPASDADDFPYTDTQYMRLLQDVVTYRGQSAAQCQHGATLLMTSRVFTNNVIGQSNVGSACFAQAAGIIEINFGEQQDALIVAHELGHIFGADHDGDAAGSCPNEPPGAYLMTPNPLQAQNTTFSPCSARVILEQLTIHDCLVPIQAPPAASITAVAAVVSPPSGSPKGGGGAIDWLAVVFLVCVIGFRFVHENVTRVS